MCIYVLLLRLCFHIWVCYIFDQLTCMWYIFLWWWGKGAGGWKSTCVKSSSLKNGFRKLDGSSGGQNRACRRIVCGSSFFLVKQYLGLPRKLSRTVLSNMVHWRFVKRSWKSLRRIYTTNRRAHVQIAERRCPSSCVVPHFFCHSFPSLPAPPSSSFLAPPSSSSSTQPISPPQHPLTEISSSLPIQFSAPRPHTVDIVPVLLRPICIACDHRHIQC